MVGDNKGYFIRQDVNSNKIIIYLPQSMETQSNTVTPISTRKTMLTPAEEVTLLAVVREMFERKSK